MSGASITATSPIPVTTLGRQHIYILPTRHGCLFAFMLLVMLLGSINYNNSLGYMLTFLLAGMGMVTMLHTYHNLAGLSVSGGRASPAFRGGQAHFQILLDNRGGAARHSLELARQAPRRSRPWRRRQLPEPRLQDAIPGGKLCNIGLDLPAERRGILSLGRIRLSSTFPLGLFRAWCWVDPGLSTLVYPQPHGQLPLPRRGGHQSTGMSGRQAGNDDFSGFRPYRPGDPPRNIAWKALARGNETLVKRFSGSGGDSAELDWHSLAGLSPEARLSQLCRWVLEACRCDLRFSLNLPGKRLAAAGGEAHRDDCLQALALYPHS